jgi:hypothetical protein
MIREAIVVIIHVVAQKKERRVLGGAHKVVPSGFVLGAVAFHREGSQGCAGERFVKVPKVRLSNGGSGRNFKQFIHDELGVETGSNLEAATGPETSRSENRTQRSVRDMGCFPHAVSPDSDCPRMGETPHTMFTAVT